MRKNTDFFQFLVMKGKGLWFVSKSRFLYCSLQHFHNYYKVQTVLKTFVRFGWLRLCLSQSLLTLAITFASSFAVFISPFASCRLLVWSYFGHIPNNRSVRKEQEMDLKREATVEGSRNKSFRSFVFVYSCILFTEHCNLPDVMLTTNTFA